MDKFIVWHQCYLYRTKVIAVLVFMLATTLSCWAQPNLSNHDNKRVHFGISLGFNSGNFAITHSESFAYHDSIKVVESPNSPGFNVGIISDLHLSKHADFRFIPTLVFAEKDLDYVEVGTAGDVIVNETVESIILEFPVTFKYKSDRFYDNFRFYVLGGGRLDWDLGSNSDARKASDIIKIDKYDFSLEYGAGLEFYFPLFIFSPEIKFTQGMYNLHVPTNNLRYSDVLGKLRSQYFTLSFQFEG